MKRFLWILLGYIICVLILTYPATFHLTDRIIGDGGDNYQFLGFQYVAKLQFEQGIFPFGWTNYWRYPTGFDFAGSYDSSLLLLIGIVLYQLIHNPVVVYNLSVLMLLTSNVVLSFFLFEKVSKNTLIGFIGGAIYGFSYYALARMGGHPNLILIGVFPFFVYAIWEWFEKKGSWKSYMLVTSALVLVFLASLQYLLILCGALLLVAPFAVLFYPKICKEMVLIAVKTWQKVITALIISTGIFLFFNYSRVAGIVSGTFILPTAEFVPLPIINFFLPNEYLNLVFDFGLNTSKKWIEYSLFVGYVELILFSLFILFVQIEKRFKFFLLTIIALFWLISSGGVLYSYLFHVLPFRGIIEPGRFFVVIFIVIISGIVFLLKRYEQLLGRLGLGLLIVLLLFERLPNHYYLSSTRAQEPFIEVVKQTNTKGVLDVPIFWDWWNGNIYDLYSIYYEKPIVNGYIHWSGNTKEANYFLEKTKRFECSMDTQFVPQRITEEKFNQEVALNQELLRDFRGYGITTIVLHKDLVTTQDACDEAREEINVLLYHSGISFSQIYADAEKEVYILSD